MHLRFAIRIFVLRLPAPLQTVCSSGRALFVKDADENAQANVWNEDADYLTMVNWKTFPERLEENGISWKIYQNELSVGVGFEGEEDGWLANFGDNPIEYFTQYHVKLHPEYIAALPKIIEQLNEELAEETTKITNRLMPVAKKQNK